MIPDWLLIQAAALLTGNELNTLFAAIGTLWGTIVVLATILWRIGVSWVNKVNAKIEKVEEALAKVPSQIRDALDEHNKEDIRRHEEQLAAIRKNADVYANAWGKMQLDQALMTQRLEVVEDTDRTDRKPKGKR